MARLRRSASWRGGRSADENQAWNHLTQQLTKQLSLCTHRLHVHRLLDSRAREDILEFVPQAPDSPRRRCMVDRLDDRRVEILATGEGLIESQLTELATHRGLSQLDHTGDDETESHTVSATREAACRTQPSICDRRVINIRHSIAGLDRVFDLDVEHAIDVDRDVVERDRHLVEHRYGLLLEVLHVRDAIDHRKEEVQASVERLREPTETLDDVRRLLRHHDQTEIRRGGGLTEAVGYGGGTGEAIKASVSIRGGSAKASGG